MYALASIGDLSSHGSKTAAKFQERTTPVTTPRNRPARRLIELVSRRPDGLTNHLNSREKAGTANGQSKLVSRFDFGVPIVEELPN